MSNPWANLSEHTKLQIIKWSYLLIVVMATITLTIVVINNKRLVRDIQRDRVQVAYSNCLEVNARHDELDQFLDEQEGPTNPLAVKFINILAPKKNCVVFVENLLGSKPDESN